MTSFSATCPAWEAAIFWRDYDFVNGQLNTCFDTPDHKKNHICVWDMEGFFELRPQVRKHLLERQMIVFDRRLARNPHPRTDEYRRMCVAFLQQAEQDLPQPPKNPEKTPKSKKRSRSTGKN